jgi:hypothetical protein
LRSKKKIHNKKSKSKFKISVAELRSQGAASVWRSRSRTDMQLQLRRLLMFIIKDYTVTMAILHVTGKVPQFLFKILVCLAVGSEPIGAQPA